MKLLSYFLKTSFLGGLTFIFFILFISSTPVFAAAVAPTDVRASADTTGAINLSWTQGEGDTGTRYFIQEQDDCTGTPVLLTDTTFTSYTIDGLDANRQYCFSVASSDEDGDSAYEPASPVYTLAITPGVPFASDPTTSTITFVIDPSTNPTNTTYSIYNVTDGRYIAADGRASSVFPVYRSASAWGFVLIKGLSLNTSYEFEVTARNGDAIDSDSSTSAALYTLTLPAHVPHPVFPSPTSLFLSVPSDTNPANTTYAFYNVTDGLYIAVDGSESGTPTYQTANDWSEFEAIGLSPNTSYQFALISRNGDGVDADSSSNSAPVFTAANTPGIPTIAALSSSELFITIHPNSNPVDTNYAVYNTLTGHYVALDGSDATSTPAWQSKADWDVTLLNGLTPNTSYTFSVSAENNDGVSDGTFSFGSAPIYTFANVATQPVVSALSPTRLRIIPQPDGNPLETQFAVYNETTHTWVGGDELASDDPVFQNSSVWGTFGLSGLISNTAYQFSVVTRNDDGIVSATSTISESVFTWANVPGTPIVSNPTTSTVQVLIDTNENNNDVQYAIYNSTEGVYVNSDGGIIGMPVFQTSSTWGVVTVLGQGYNTHNQFSVIAENSDFISTDTSDLSDGSVYTLAEAVARPTVATDTNHSLAVTFDPDQNSLDTRYAVYNSTNSVYLQADGSPGDATPVYATYATWTGGTAIAPLHATGLMSDTTYTFRVTARNGNDIDAADSPVSLPVRTLANTAGAPIISEPTTSTLSLILATNGNKPGVTYAIYNGRDDNYIDADGSATIVPFFQTSSTWGTVIMKGLSSNTDYAFEVVAQNEDGDNAPFSGESSVVYTLATIPSSLIATPNGTTQIDLSWTGNGTTYQIHNLTLSSDSSLAAGTTRSIPGLSCGILYEFTVTAQNGDGVSSSSSISASATTAACPVTDPTPPSSGSSGGGNGGSGGLAAPTLIFQTQKNGVIVKTGSSQIILSAPVSSIVSLPAVPRPAPRTDRVIIIPPASLVLTSAQKISFEYRFLNTGKTTKAFLITRVLVNAKTNARLSLVSTSQSLKTGQAFIRKVNESLPPRLPEGSYKEVVSVIDQKTGVRLSQEVINFIVKNPKQK